MKRLLFILVIIVITVYFQYPYINSEDNSYEILQYNNPEKSIFESMVNEKKISIFTNIPTNYKIKNKLLVDMDQKTLLENKNNKSFNDNISKILDYYRIPLCVNNNNNFNISNQTKIYYQNNYRLLLLNLGETINICLFAPKERALISKKYNINFKNKKNLIKLQNDIQNNSVNNEITYIEVLLHQNMMISIPYKWIYYINPMNNNAKYIIQTNESVFSCFLKN